VGNGVQLASKTGVSKSIPDGEVHMGFPSMPGRQFHRSFAIYRNLPDLSAKVTALEKQIAELKLKMENF
jgi:UDP-3-O-[3-hydroxymyristoyl] glucosamine N-acyltransferase